MSPVAAIVVICLALMVVGPAIVTIGEGGEILLLYILLVLALVGWERINRG